MDVVTTRPFAVARPEINPGQLPSVLRIMAGPPPRKFSRILEMRSAVSDLG